MTVMLFAPDPKAASRMAKRLLPDSKIVHLEERPANPANQENLRTFWSDVQRLLHTPSPRPRRPVPTN